MKVVLRSIDLEASGYEPPAEIIEVGYTDVVFDTESHVAEVGEPVAKLYGVSTPLTAENMAVHHITNRMIEGLPLCTPGDLADVVLGADFMVAHNWSFEGRWITPEILGATRPICTFKCGLRIYDEAVAHSNQALRYHLDLDIDHYTSNPPHRAGPDSYVTAHILVRMLDEALVRDLVGWTMAPRYYATCPLKKHRGQRWEDIPGDYLHWMVHRADEIEADLKAAAAQELERRKALHA